MAAAFGNTACMQPYMAAPQSAESQAAVAAHYCDHDLVSTHGYEQLDAEGRASAVMWCTGLIVEVTYLFLHNNAVRITPQNAC